MSFSVGVPTTSTFIAAATAKQNKTTLEMLIHLQKLVEEFKYKVAEMDEEMRAVKSENAMLKNKILELTPPPPPPSPPSRLPLSISRFF